MTASHISIAPNQNITMAKVELVRREDGIRYSHASHLNPDAISQHRSEGCISLIHLPVLLIRLWLLSHFKLGVIEACLGVLPRTNRYVTNTRL